MLGAGRAPLHVEMSRVRRVASPTGFFELESEAQVRRREAFQRSYFGRLNRMATKKLGMTGLVVAVVIALDLVTKRWALEELSNGRTLELLGGAIPLTLTFNQGAAFGLTIGDDPRWFFIPVTFVAIGFLIALIWQSGPAEHARVVAAAFVLGGAIGNLYDRIRWDRGVVDFIGPIDLGFMDWPIFNVADMAITCGAVLLAISFIREDLRGRGEELTDEDSGQAGSDKGKDRPELGA